MRGAVLKIGDDEYPLTEVTLSAHQSKEDDEHFLTVNLFADTEGLSRAGFAINSITFRGLREVHGLQDLSFVLGPDSDDPLNELGESVICKPGRVLELERLSLKFGQVSGDRIDAHMEAVCSDEGALWGLSRAVSQRRSKDRPNQCFHPTRWGRAAESLTVRHSSLFHGSSR